MKATPPPLIGRDSELALVQRFVHDLEAGPASLILDGQAGVGKTALWSQALLAAEDAGVVVRSCRCSESDAVLAFAGLGDLLEDLEPDVLAALPAVQRRALSAALLLSEPDDTAARSEEVEPAAPGARVLGVAVLGVLRELSRSEPLLLAVDDLQWLDAGSRDVLGFALRRLADEPVRLLASRRSGSRREPAGAADLGMPPERLEIGPVSVGIIRRILQTRLDLTLSRPVLIKVHKATGGNPMMALEIGRALRRRGVDPAPGDPLPVPTDLSELVAERLRGLAPRTRQLLLVAAVLAQPTISGVGLVLDDPAAAEAALREATEAGLLETDGERVRFTHPLIASVPYAQLSLAARRELHRRVAATVPDPEEHARHAALGSDEPSNDVAAALERAAVHARGRGSLDAAAELAELALTCTPMTDGQGVLRRTVQVAELLFLAGDVARARALLTVGLDAASPGPDRVKGLLLQASMASLEQGDATVAAWCDQALAEAGEDVLSQALCHATFAETSPSGAVVDLWHAERAVALLETVSEPPPGVMANALTNVAMHGFRLGRGLAVETLERAVALQALAAPVTVSDRAGLGLGMYLKNVDRFEESRAWLQAMRTCAIDEGDDSALPLTVGHLATLECWAGHYGQALDYAVEGRDHAARMGIRAPMPASAHVLALAYLGRTDDARALGESDLAADASYGFTSAMALDLRSLGVTALIAGDLAGAAECLLRALAISADEVGIDEPAILRLHPDAVHALVGLDRLDDAARLTEQLDASTRANHQPWSTATAGRCHGLLHAANGDLPAALASLEHALVDHQLLPMPFEEALTRLQFGRVLRRAGHRTDARRELETARQSFVRLGTPVQARLAGAELDSVGGRRRPEGELTPVEARIAGLVVVGRTNREVAVELTLSVRTVESHLGRIYRKLGVRSRTELAARQPA